MVNRADGTPIGGSADAGVNESLQQVTSDEGLVLAPCPVCKVRFWCDLRWQATQCPSCKTDLQGRRCPTCHVSLVGRVGVPTLVLSASSECRTGLNGSILERLPVSESFAVRRSRAKSLHTSRAQSAEDGRIFLRSPITSTVIAAPITTLSCVLSVHGSSPSQRSPVGSATAASGCAKVIERPRDRIPQ